MYIMRFGVWFELMELQKGSFRGSAWSLQSETIGSLSTPQYQLSIIPSIQNSKPWTIIEDAPLLAIISPRHCPEVVLTSVSVSQLLSISTYWVRYRETVFPGAKVVSQKRTPWICTIWNQEYVCSLWFLRLGDVLSDKLVNAPIETYGRPGRLACPAWGQWPDDRVLRLKHP